MSELRGLDDWLTREPADEPRWATCRGCRQRFAEGHIAEHERTCLVDYIADVHGFEECLITLVNWLARQREEMRGPAHVRAGYGRVEECLDAALLAWQRMERELAQWDQAGRGEYEGY